MTSNGKMASPGAASNSRPTEPPLSVHPTYPIQNYHHSQTNCGSIGGVQSPGLAAEHPLSHGYNQPQPSQHEVHIDPELRSSPGANSAYPPVPNMMPTGAQAVPPQPSPVLAPPKTPIEAQTAEAINAGDSGDGPSKAKRELSQSKRAAQNRAAQRAFRQRKEGYIKKLEQQVRDLAGMEDNYKTLREENYALREYIVHLQSRLLDAQGEYPQPPPNVNLSHPLATSPTSAPATAESLQSAGDAASAVGSSLEVAAQAVAGLNRSDIKFERADEEARTAEEMARQLQVEGAPAGVPQADM